MWKHACFCSLLSFIHDSLKGLKNFLAGRSPPSPDTTKPTEIKNEKATRTSNQEDDDEEEEEELFEINLDAINKRIGSNFLNSDPVTLHFGNTNQVRLANCLSTVLELSAAVPVTDQVPSKTRLPPEVIAKWVLEEDFEKVRSPSFREFATNIKRLVSLKMLNVSERSEEETSDFEFK